VHGGSPQSGFVRGRQFLHPELRFTFTVPPGFKINNGPTAIIAAGPEGVKLKFDMAKLRQPVSMAAYLTSIWANDVSLRNPESLIINGMQAATAETVITGEAGRALVRLIAIGFSPDTVARLMILTPDRPGAAMQEELRRFTYSFRSLTPDEAGRLSPLRIRVIPVQAGDTMAGIAGHMPFEDYREPRFRVLNGFGLNDTLRPGQRVKIVAQ